MDMADVIIFVCDAKEGLTTDDREVAMMLRRTKKPVVLVINKADSGKAPDTLYDFYELGLGEAFPISAANMTGLGDVLDAVTADLPKVNAEDEDETTKVAIIGKPNVGKSSLVNKLIGENRMIVSDIAGTTRDSVDTPFEFDGEQYTLIDTAGLRKKARVTEDLERYSVLRAIAAIERSDVCIIMIGADEGLTDQDKKIAGLAHEAGKGVVITVNKWDLIEKQTGTLETFKKKLIAEVPFLSYAPVIFISVKTGQRVKTVMETAHAVANSRSVRIQTGPLNSLIQDAMVMHPAPTDKGKRLKIYYVSQVGIRPPLFSFKINSRELMHFSYARYLENRIREAYGFEGTSIKFVFREKGENYT
jgi:GTP-binding protein